MDITFENVFFYIFSSLGILIILFHFFRFLFQFCTDKWKRRDTWEGIKTALFMILIIIALGLGVFALEFLGDFFGEESSYCEGTSRYGC